MATARSAAAVMILRDRTGATGSGREDVCAAVFMPRRLSTMEFAPRMMVFPGGGVDPRDAASDLPWAGLSPAQCRFGNSWSQMVGRDRGLVVSEVCPTARWATALRRWRGPGALFEHPETGKIPTQNVHELPNRAQWGGVARRR